jgi:serine/threonine-protein kinase
MISVRVGSLQEADTQAVLRPVRSDLAGITQASRRLEAAAGDKVRRRLDAMGELPVSSAVLTPGGDLPVGFIIHVVLEGPDESPTALGIQRALVNGLRRAREWEMTSLAMPPLGLGAGSLDPEDSAQMMVEVLLDHLREGEPPRELVIVVENPYEEELFRRLLASAESV